MAKSTADRIKAIQDRLAKLAAQENVLKAKAKTEERSRDTRRKIVVGAAVIVEMEKNAAFAEAIRGVLNARVGRPVDREVIASLLKVEPEPTSSAA